MNGTIPGLTPAAAKALTGVSHTFGAPFPFPLAGGGTQNVRFCYICKTMYEDRGVYLLDCPGYPKVSQPGLQIDVFDSRVRL